MKNKLKLSPKQKEIVKFMQDGIKLLVAIIILQHHNSINTGKTFNQNLNKAKND